MSTEKSSARWIDRRCWKCSCAKMALSEQIAAGSIDGGAGLRAHPWLLAWGVALMVTLALYLMREHWPWGWHYPREWSIPLRFWISDFMKWLINDFNLGLFTFKELTRSISWVLHWPLAVADGLLSSGCRG